MASQIAPFGLRMPEDLKEWVKKKARMEGRSMNNTIVQILREMKAAGVQFGDHAPAAGTTEKNPNHQEATSHDGDDFAIRV